MTYLPAAFTALWKAWQPSSATVTCSEREELLSSKVNNDERRQTRDTYHQPCGGIPTCVIDVIHPYFNSVRHCRVPRLWMRDKGQQWGDVLLKTPTDIEYRYRASTAKDELTITLPSLATAAARYTYEHVPCNVLNRHCYITLQWDIRQRLVGIRWHRLHRHLIYPHDVQLEFIHLHAIDALLIQVCSRQQRGHLRRVHMLNDLLCVYTDDRYCLALLVGYASDNVYLECF
jgi:hypothetical protein